MHSYRCSVLRVTPLIVTAAATVGCAVGPRTMELLEPLPVSIDAATVAVWREKQFCGAYPLNYVLIDDRPIVALATGQHTAFQISAGRHSVGVFHSVIDAPLLVGSGPAALPVGAAFGMHGMSSTDTFSAGSSYNYILRSKCVTFDEDTRVSIERVDGWPSGASPSPEDFVPPGRKH